MMQFSDQASVIGMMSNHGYHAGAIRHLLIRQAYSTVRYDTMLVTNLTGVLPPPGTQLAGIQGPVSVV